MSPDEAVRTTIGEDVEISGNIKCESGIQIHGKLNGDLNCASQAQIGTSSAVKGNLSVETVSIMGQVNGNITAKDKIELKSSAKLHGDIRARRLTVEDGVTFVGKVEVNPTGSGAGKQQEPKQPATETEADEPGKETDAPSKGIFRR
jgi:cytoskeletal protein CcmA (bactofilin family)